MQQFYNLQLFYYISYNTNIILLRGQVMTKALVEWDKKKVRMSASQKAKDARELLFNTLSDTWFVIDEKLKTTEEELLLADLLKALNVLKTNEPLTTTTKLLEPGMDPVKDPGITFFKGYEAVLTFIDAQKPKLEAMFGKFNRVGEDFKDDIKTLGTLLYGEGWKPDLTVVDADNAKEETNFVSLYRAKNGELVLRFKNREERDIFYAKLPKAQTPARFIRADDPQYFNNPKGETPAIYNEDGNCLYFPSYKAAYGEFAINCGTSENRNKLVELLGLTFEINEKDESRHYGNDLFTAYDHESQSNALYFNQNNRIFNEQNSYLRVDTKSGKISQHEFQKEEIAVEMPDAGGKGKEKDKVKEVKQAALKEDECRLSVQQRPGQNGYDLKIEFAYPYIRELWQHAFDIQMKNFNVVEFSDWIVKDAPNTMVIMMSEDIETGGVYYNMAYGAKFFDGGQLSINFLDPQLRDFFKDSFNLGAYTGPNGKLSLPVDQLSKGNALLTHCNTGFVQASLIEDDGISYHP